MSAMARRHRSEQRRLLGLRRAVRWTWEAEPERAIIRFNRYVEDSLLTRGLDAAVARAHRDVH